MKVCVLSLAVVIASFCVFACGPHGIVRVQASRFAVCVIAIVLFASGSA